MLCAETDNIKWKLELDIKKQLKQSYEPALKLFHLRKHVNKKTYHYKFRKYLNKWWMRIIIIISEYDLPFLSYYLRMWHTMCYHVYRSQ
jgi:hypothetical protein